MQRFLIVGQTGVGKSSFVNATFGVKMANTSAFEACTHIVEEYRDQTPYGAVCLIDTPGMSEDVVDTDLAYLQLVRDALLQKPADVTLYITRLNDTRMRADEMRTLKLLTTHLGSAIWKNAWIVFTFAASVPAEELNITAAKRYEQIVSFLSQIVTDSNFSDGFQKIILIDNIVPNWHNDAVHIASILTSTA